MTLKTNGEKIFYWIFTSAAIITGLVLSIIYTTGNSARKVMLAADDDKVYLVDAYGCGKCTSDVWLFSGTAPPTPPRHPQHQTHCPHWAAMC